MWTARPVFISSTFLDMQAERDYLRTRVFPELEERLRARRHNLEWVDLRVGVATAAESDANARELHILKVCLAEVKRCRPFLIVLLGDRYGWAPPEDRVRAAAAEEGFKADIAGRSITDLEIDFGVLSDPEQQPRSIFYFRDPLPYRDMPPQLAALFSNEYEPDSGAADRGRRLATLKQRIETQLPTRVRHYAAQWDAERQCVSGLELWGQMVLEDIWSELEVETRDVAAAVDISWQQAERSTLDDFAEDRARDFVGRQAIIARLTSLCLSPARDGTSWGICVTGDPGSGKSALFGALYRPPKPETEKVVPANQRHSSGSTCRLGGSDVFLLAHATGASVAAASVDSMLRRWILELATALGIRDVGLAENADAETVEATFVRLLGQKASQQRVVVLVDALDQFESTGRAQTVAWLPRQWPPNARFLATTIVGKTSQALSNRAGIETLPMPPLNDVEARAIVAGVCNRYHRTFEPEVTNTLMAKSGIKGSAWANPLWLVLAVEELNLLDADDFASAQRDYMGVPGERLRDLMLDRIKEFPDSIPGLYGHTFERAEKLFGAGVTQGFLGLIAVSRAGWRESDFRILLPRVSGASWDVLKFAQLRRFFRGQIRRRGALGQWDFNHGQMRIAARRRLLAQGISEDDIHTLIVDHLLSLPEDDPLRASQTTVHMFCSSRGGDAFVTSRIAIALADGMSRSNNIAQVLNGLGNLERAVNPVDLNKSLARYRAFFETHYPKNETRSALEEQLGDIYRAHGNLDLALESYRSALSSRENSVTTKPAAAGLLQNPAGLHAKIADTLGTLASNELRTAGGLDSALSHCREAHSIRLRLAASDATNIDWQEVIAASHDMLGNIFQARGDSANALMEFESGRDVLLRVVAIDPKVPHFQHALSIEYKNIGEVLHGKGEMEMALQSYKLGMAITERLAADDPRSTRFQSLLSEFHARIGDIFWRQAEFEAALASYSACRTITEMLSRSDLANTEWPGKLSWLSNRIQTVSADLSNFAMLCQFTEMHLARARPGQTLQVALPGGWSDGMQRRFQNWCAQMNYNLQQILPDKTCAFIQK
jgi:tetratricopeptide (TPR) repeat protein